MSMDLHPDELESDVASLIDRLNSIPLFGMTLTGLRSTYSSIKERNFVFEGALNRGEQCVQRATDLAKPIAIAATRSALKMAEPVVGQVADPVQAIDSAASETLAKFQEKFPLINETPSKIVSSLKAAAQDTVSSYIHAVHDTANSYMQTTPVKVVSRRLDDAVSVSEMVVEIFLPGDDVVDRATKRKAHAERRTEQSAYEPVQVTTVGDAVRCAQEKIRRITHCLHQCSLLLSQRIYATSMCFPMMAVEVSSDVFLSTRELFFAYHKAHSFRECPHAIVEMSEICYKKLKLKQPIVAFIEEEVVNFILMPSQMVSRYTMYATRNPAVWPQEQPNEITEKAAATTEDPLDDANKPQEAQEADMLPLSNYPPNLFN